MPKRHIRIISAVCVLLATAGCAVRPESIAPPSTAAAAKPPAAPAPPVVGAATPTTPGAAIGFGAALSSGEPRKYEDVVTKDAKTVRGMFLHHKVKERHLFEIPQSLLGREFLWSVEMSQASVGGGFNGLPLGYRVLRFDRVENRILLRSVSYRNRGINDLKLAAETVDLAPIVLSFNVEAEGSERSLELRAEEKRALEQERDAKAAAAKKSAGIPGTSAEADAAPTAATIATPAAPAGGTRPVPERRPPPQEKWPVIDVSRLFITTSSDLIDARNMGPYGFGGVDSSRSIVGQVKVFPRNIEVRSTLTFAAFQVPALTLGGQPAMPSIQRNPSKTAVLHYSFALLPETPMPGRYFDERVGYFTEPFLEYGGERSGVRGREFIARFRLDKKNPSAALSEPVTPITFYIGREVPEKWQKAMIAGVEDWQPAFEAAGFRHAIRARLAPSPQEDPAWDAEDARHSVIRWVAMPIANAMGPHVHDPRSGEIVSAHIVFWHDLLAGLEQGYFVQAGAADARIDKLPIPDTVMAELIRSVTTHEVGHALGLRHNHRAATAYSVKDLRQPAFAATHGTSASIMSYARFNSVAQPGDGVTSFVPKLGPYDRFAIEWGYKPLGKATPEEETPLLDRMAARQLTEPQLAFGGEDFAAYFDPEVQTENLGRERIEATRLSIASLERAAARLVAGTTRLGEDYDVLESTYFQLLRQRNSTVGSVVKLIGGVRETRYMGGRGGDTFTRTSPAEQRAAMRYLLDEALATPQWLADPAVLNRLAPFDVARPVVESQKSILADMLLPIRFRVLEDAEMLKTGSGMLAADYLTAVQTSMFREAVATHPKVDIYRRELQREYVEHLKVFSGEVQRFKSFSMLIAGLLTDYSIDLRPAAMQGLKELKRSLDSAERRAQDRPTRLHFAQLAREVEKVLKIRGS